MLCAGGTFYTLELRGQLNQLLMVSCENSKTIIFLNVSE